MTYHFTKIVDMSFDDAVISTKVALKRHNFRVLTEIDMKDNFKGAECRFSSIPHPRSMQSGIVLSSAPGGRQDRYNVTLQRCSAATRGRSS